MNRLQTLAQRREELVARSGAQRSALVAAAAPIARRAATADRALAYVRAHPVLSSVVVGAVMLLGPRKLLELGTRAVALYALIKR
jgi:hypothetical protein